MSILPQTWNYKINNSNILKEKFNLMLRGAQIRIKVHHHILSIPSTKRGCREKEQQKCLVLFQETLLRKQDENIPKGLC